MSKASYSLDLRVRIVAMYDDGLSAEDVAEVFKVHPNTVRNYIRRRDTSGSVDPLPHGGSPPRKLTDEDREALKRLHEAAPDAYLRELCDRLEAERGKRVGLETMRRELAKMGLTRKKNTSKQRSKTDRTSS